MGVVRWLLPLYLFAFLPLQTVAQPKRSRVQTQQQQQKQQSAGSSQMTQRMRIQYPTALDMSEDVVWRRDIYRELDLNDEANSGLYYPVQPVGKQLNLFTYIFKLALNGYIPVYEYNMDGNEDLTDASKVNMKTILDNYHIFYEEQDGKVRVDNSDIPSAEVMRYFLKESAYYDQANSSFHIKVLALCPVMLREDDFGGEAAKYPLFWVKYSDLEPFLSRQTVRTSSVNDAAVMSMDDYFTLNKYQGKIYKTSNLLGKTLAQIAGGDTTKLSEEQRRIEAELQAFRSGIFGSHEKKEQTDSLDSIAAADPKAAKAVARKAKAASRRSSASTASSTKAAKATRRRSSTSSSSSSGAARVSVRRQRH